MTGRVGKHRRQTKSSKRASSREAKRARFRISSRVIDTLFTCGAISVVISFREGDSTEPPVVSIRFGLSLLRWLSVPTVHPPLVSHAKQGLHLCGTLLSALTMRTTVQRTKRPPSLLKSLQHWWPTSFCQVLVWKMPLWTYSMRIIVEIAILEARDMDLAPSQVHIQPTITKAITKRIVKTAKARWRTRMATFTWENGVTIPDMVMARSPLPTETHSKALGNVISWKEKVQLYGVRVIVMKDKCMIING